MQQSHGLLATAKLLVFNKVNDFHFRLAAKNTDYNISYGMLQLLLFFAKRLNACIPALNIRLHATSNRVHEQQQQQQQQLVIVTYCSTAEKRLQVASMKCNCDLSDTGLPTAGEHMP